MYKLEPDGDGNDVYQVNRNQIGKMSWTVKGRCAYPADMNKLGGDILLSTYGSKAQYYFNKASVANYDTEDWKSFAFQWSNSISEKDIEPGEEGFQLLIPNIEANDRVVTFSNSGIGGVPDTYSYNKDIASLTVGSDGKYKVNGNLIIYVKPNTFFDIRYLPLMQISYTWEETGRSIAEDFGFPFKQIAGLIFGQTRTAKGTEKTSIILPWQSATVKDKNGATMSNGISGIDTSSTTNRYTIENTFILGSYSFNLSVSIRVRNS